MLKYSTGGIDSSKFTGPMTYTYALLYMFMSTLLNFKLCSPITTVSPSNNFWGIEQSIEYGTTPILSTTAGIVDTGAFAATGKKRKGILLIDHRNHPRSYCYGCLYEIQVSHGREARQRYRFT